MAKFSFTPEERVEFERLSVAHRMAMDRTSTAAAAFGMASEEYKKADAEAGKLWLELRTLQGNTGKDWMA